MKKIFFLFLFVAAFRPASAQEKSFVPDWVRDAIFYQIFPERFANGDTTNDPPGVEKWGGTPKTNNYFGGDLQGVIDHLDYLRRLGVNAIYFNPIFESPSNHKYHTADYMKIDHNFGDEQVFKQLIDECHKRKIRVVLDGVFNHTGVHFFAFEDIKKNEAKSKYLKWYDVHSFPVGPPDKPNYEAWWGLGDLPKLMTDNPEVRKYLFDATAYWTRLGIDGWRLDVPNEIHHDFWVEWRKLVKSINPDAYIVGEIWDNAADWLKGDQFDAVMNYRFRGACVGFMALENRSATQFDSILAAQRADYPPDVNGVLQNLVGSHDTERFLTLANGEDDKLKLAVLMQMTYPGAPMVYYGDEIGMEGGRDPDCRKTMVWDTTKWNRGLLAFYTTMINLRNSHPVFRRGTFRSFLADDSRKMYGFERDLEGAKAVVMINMSLETQAVDGANGPLPSTTWYEFSSAGSSPGTSAAASDPRTLRSYSIPPRSYVILMNEKP